MNPFLWVLWALALCAILGVTAFVIGAVYLEVREKRSATAWRTIMSAAESSDVLAAVIDLHRPQVMDRRHDSDVHSTITTVCGACSNVAGEPVPFPCTTIGTIRRERHRVRAMGEKR